MPPCPPNDGVAALLSMAVAFEIRVCSWCSLVPVLSSCPDVALRSIGSIAAACFVARTLELMQWRRYAGPFDWIYSSAQMVRHCLEDDFSSFLDEKQLLKAGHAWAHAGYAQMLGRQVVFPHHRPLDRDREHFQRAVSRFREVLFSGQRTTFVFMHLVKTRKGLAKVRDAQSDHGSNLRDVQELFETLRSKVSHFHLLVVYVIEGASKWTRGASESQRGLVHIQETSEDTWLGQSISDLTGETWMG
eukprot:Skav225370  [mRNA]  locus=scaffold329:29277:41034:+ [translate_table: standard]